MLMVTWTHCRVKKGIDTTEDQVIYFHTFKILVEGCGVKTSLEAVSWDMKNLLI